VVINPSDLPNLTAILRKSIAEYERNYRTFRVVMDSSKGERRATPRAEPT
jgi:hypothetical protein